MVEFSDEVMTQLNEGGDEVLKKKLKLSSTRIQGGNMVLFDQEGRVRKFESAEKILEEFYKIRLVYYDKRKVWLIATLFYQFEKISEKLRFIIAVIKGEIIINNRKRTALIEELRQKKFKPFPPKSDDKKHKEKNPKKKKSNRAQKEDGKDEKVEQLKKELKDKELELDQTKATPVQDFWKKDLQIFLTALDKMEEEEAKGLEDATHHSSQIANKKKKDGPKTTKTTKRRKTKRQRKRKRKKRTCSKETKNERNRFI